MAILKVKTQVKASLRELNIPAAESRQSGR